MQYAVMTGTVAQVRRSPGNRRHGFRMPPARTDHWGCPDGSASVRTTPDALEGEETPPAVAAVAAFHTREQRLATLIQQIAQGDGQALAALYDATSAHVHGLALRILRDPVAAEDVVIEVYMQVQRLASAYDASRGTPSAWLLTLVRSRAIDRLRAESLRQQREAPLERAATLPSLTPGPEASSTTAELRRAVQAALLTLSPEQRQVIEIAYYAGLSHSEIATMLQQPLGTVKTRLRTGMISLRNLLQPYLDVSPC